MGRREENWRSSAAVGVAEEAGADASTPTLDTPPGTALRQQTRIELNPALRRLQEHTYIDVPR